MELEVLDIKGKGSGKKISLKDSIFGIEPNPHAIYLDVKRYRAAQRRGTAKSKERGEITGSTRKIKRQKGTGTARAGSIKNPLFRGGGRVFGPRPRNYAHKLNKSLVKLAKRSAISIKAKAGQIAVVEGITWDVPSTRSFVNVVHSLKLSDKKLLFVLGDSNKNVYLSSRNLQGVKVVNSTELSTYDILNAQNIVFVEAAVSKIEQLLG
ncbi:MAG: 50S ribosomal protein L4 [Flavobacteriales bacterium]